MATRKSKPPIKVAVLVDPWGSVMMGKTGDDEYADHQENFARVLKGRKLVFERLHAFDDAKVNADLVVFDFGGMTMGNDLLGSNSRAVLRWVQDHPSSLLVVASQFTYAHGLVPELRDLGIIPDDGEYVSAFDRPKESPLPNVIVYEGWNVEQENKIRHWFEPRLGQPARARR